MTIIVFLNGPPKSGKTLIAEHLARVHDFKYVNFADSIKSVLSVLFPLEHYEKFKHQELYDDYTGRDFIIDFAESFIKPKLGQDFFAKMLVDKITAQSFETGLQNIVIGDLGFDVEYHAAYKKFVSLGQMLQTPIDMQLWHIVRNGTNFEKDSRNYVDKPTNVVYNNSSIEALTRSVSQLVN